MRLLISLVIIVAALTGIVLVMVYEYYHPFQGDIEEGPKL